MKLAANPAPAPPAAESVPPAVQEDPEEEMERDGMAYATEKDAEKPGAAPACPACHVIITVTINRKRIPFL